jgi:hypothetical protein
VACGAARILRRMTKYTRKVPLPAVRRSWTIAQRLIHYTKVDPVSGCHIWQASTRDTGYGQLHLHGRNLLAHRVAWEIKHGSIPKGMNLCHRCDERRCINPDHLFIASQSANMADRSRKDRARRRLAHADRRRSDVAIVRLYYRGVQMKGELSVEPFDPDAVLHRATHALSRHRGRWRGSPRRRGA